MLDDRILTPTKEEHVKATSLASRVEAARPGSTSASIYLSDLAAAHLSLDMKRIRYQFSHYGFVGCC
jgi:hypothetical protein